VPTAFDLTEQEDYSHTTRKRAYKRKLESNYAKLDQRAKDRCLQNLAHEMSKADNGVERLNSVLKAVGWVFENGVLLSLSEPPENAQTSSSSGNPDMKQPKMTTLMTRVKPAVSKKVFIVHGHDSGSRETVARFIEKIGLEPIILQEQANRGLTIIEKVETYGDVSFAIILLTPDDEGGKRGDQPRPRPPTECCSRIWLLYWTSGARSCLYLSDERYDGVAYRLRRHRLGTTRSRWSMETKIGARAARRRL
jgi:Predicted nucleotide-binding protein containing TIR-like domain